MKSIINKFLSPQLFAACYLPYLALNLMTVINVLAITRFCLIFFAIWGVAICIKTFLFSGKDIYLQKHMSILIGFLAVCFITQVINFKYGGAAAIGRLAYFALCILILYSQYKGTVDNYKKTLLFATRTISCIITPAIIASLIMFFTLYTGRIDIRSGGAAYVGVAENRLYGVFSSPNVGGMYALILIWCSIINLYYLKKSKFRPLWIGASIFQILIALMFISVALSRGTYLAGAALLVTFLLVRIPFSFEKKLNIWLQGAIRALSVFVCLAVAIGAFSVLRLGCIRITETVIASKQQIQQQTPTTTPEQTPTTTPEQTPTTTTEQTPATTPEQTPTETPEQPADNNYDSDQILENLQTGFDGRVENQKGTNDITNKRMDIWKANVSILKGKTLLFGVNEPYDYYKIEKAAGKEFTHHQFVFIEYAKGNLHNGYLQILVHCGVVALGIYLIFIMLCTFKSIIYLFKTVKNTAAYSEKYKLFSLALPMVVNILANNIVESNMALMGANFFQAVFWFAAGITVFCIQSKGNVIE